MDTHRPFTRADAVAAGISPGLLRGSRFRRIFRNVYVDARTSPTRRERTVAALLVHPPTAWASHSSAAELYGVWVPDEALTHVSVTDARDRRWQPGIKPHVAPVTTTVRTVAGLRVSNPVRLFIELASMLDLVDLVVAGDSMLRVLRLSKRELVTALEATREYWSSPARAAAVHLREEVDSPMESRLRMLLVLAGLPVPVVNHRIRDHDGRVLVRFDLCYPELKLAVEYDGRQHADDLRQWAADLDRREFTDDLDFRIVKVTAEGIFRHPERTLARVAYAIRRRGGIVPTRSDDWRPHFPSRPTAA